MDTPALKQAHRALLRHRRKAATLLSRPALRTSRELFVRAYRASRAHSRAAERACKRYGNHGTLTSGVVREHFPHHVKRGLRCLAHRVSFLCDAAWQARPKRTRRDTMHGLRAAIKMRDGCGFYG